MGDGKRKVSTVIGTNPPSGKRGHPTYNREEIYRWLYVHSDYRGIVIYPQTEVAKQIEIPHQNLSEIYKEFIALGYIKKHSHTMFEIVYDPDELDWGDDFRREIWEVTRKR